jgi:hypothetical protein
MILDSPSKFPISISDLFRSIYLNQKKLFLKVNEEKTKVAYMRDIPFLSYAFGRSNGKCQYYIHKDSIRKMKDKIRELTSRNNGWGYAYRKQRLSWYIRGWLNYFKLAGMRHRIKEWDGWLLTSTLFRHVFYTNQ